MSASSTLDSSPPTWQLLGGGERAFQGASGGGILKRKGPSGIKAARAKLGTVAKKASRLPGQILRASVAALSSSTRLSTIPFLQTRELRSQTKELVRGGPSQLWSQVCLTPNRCSKTLWPAANPKKQEGIRESWGQVKSGLYFVP